MYHPHPSERLNELFRNKPYQGADPNDATFLFIGLDANYSLDIERTSAFQSVLEYHWDGVAFWHRNGVHHPFLLPHYKGDGRRYHRTFSNIGFLSNHAHLVSFAELINVPTVGRSNLVPQDLNLTHLHNLNESIIHGNAKYIFVSAGVALLMKKSKVFSWLQNKPSSSGPLKTLYSDNSRTVYSHLHFSNYGKFQKQLDEEARYIATLIP